MGNMIVETADQIGFLDVVAVKAKNELICNSAYDF